ncbi:MAG: lasso peptide biosynthesis B2 protein [Alphaproteobacteria bacterium]
MAKPVATTDHGPGATPRLSVRHILSRLRELPPSEIALAAEAFATLAVVRAGLAVLPFATVMRLFRLRSGPAPSSAEAECAARDYALRRIGRAIDRGQRLAPFRAVCLEQAIAACLMIRRRRVPTHFHLGVAKGDESMTAHAWACSGSRIVTGRAGIGDHVRIATFTA